MKWHFPQMAQRYLNKSTLKAAFPVFLIGVLFVATAYLGQTYKDVLVEIIKKEDQWGIAIYILIEAVTTVLAPLTSLPLMPIASNVWGPTVTALASIVGWMAGSIVAFYISRKYGRAFVEKMFSKEKLTAVEGKVPKKNLFWSIVLLRMAIPVDVLSYVLGLFPSLSWKTYIGSTFIGIIPFAFIFAYAGTLPVWIQFLGVPIVILIVILSISPAR